MPKFEVKAHHPTGRERTIVVDANDSEQATWRGRDGGWIVDKVKEIKEKEAPKQSPKAKQPEALKPAQPAPKGDSK